MIEIHVTPESDIKDILKMASEYKGAVTIVYAPGTYKYSFEEEITEPRAVKLKDALPPWQQ